MLLPKPDGMVDDLARPRWNGPSRWTVAALDEESPGA